ncbi:ATP-dependent protease LonB [Sporanaerobium hydrogeniformans]|uniref:ATP-dependent protease LonB n=1 Tax=Sporanaerobium hydrogeniformans TaxID=3072179 RepID=A0AC61DBD7_9FIRM|nr:ATP-dependent protease LonB [Sporanaerobium hydrogeniformans]PHV70353.1 ATP-dependent protease LonB [Sporanaerobium hydrogeniformans]
MMIQFFLVGVQLFFSFVIGLYFLMQLKGQTSSKSSIHKDSVIQYERMNALRNISLTEPLSEKLRPKNEEDIIGQKDGMKALKTALCGVNPQHILIYGSPGIGKTAAARIALELAKKSSGSPFKRDAKFVEIDATTLRFDERSIADPLIGSVHDPIYQGAGAYGPAGVPQPKPGAVTKAHGGILFIDEIGELHSVQMNKLLKVLEDRKVFLESSYYSSSDENIPKHIHDVFKNGLPADFRLIGATTKMPEDIPPALRSRCVEIFFNDLSYEEIIAIVDNVVTRENLPMTEEAKGFLGKFCQNGRDAVNMLQTAYSLATLEGRREISKKDVEWVVQTGKYSPRLEQRVNPEPHIGKINGLAVSGRGTGLLLQIETIANLVGKDQGTLKVTGIIETEDLHMKNSTIKRKSMVASSIENVLTILKIRYNIEVNDYFIHINFPSGMPIDGPSAGIAIFSSVYSAICNKSVSGEIAMTGEVSIQGDVCPVGGVYEKVLAASRAGAKKVIIPKANMQELLLNHGVEIVAVERIEEVVEAAFDEALIDKANTIMHA